MHFDHRGPCYLYMESYPSGRTLSRGACGVLRIKTNRRRKKKTSRELEELLKTEGARRKRKELTEHMCRCRICEEDSERTMFHASGPFRTFELTRDDTAMSQCDFSIALRSTMIPPPKDITEPLESQRTYVSYVLCRVSRPSCPGRDENNLVACKREI